jgi:flagellar biosynthesis protein FliQ
MTQTAILQLGQDAAKMILLIAGPLLGISLIVGLAISIFQAVTQINEMTLSFVPKLLAMFAAMFFLGPWLISKMSSYTIGIFDGLPNWVR